MDASIPLKRPLLRSTIFPWGFAGDTRLGTILSIWPSLTSVLRTTSWNSVSLRKVIVAQWLPSFSFTSSLASVVSCSSSSAASVVDFSRSFAASVVDFCKSLAASVVDLCILWAESSNSSAVSCRRIWETKKDNLYSNKHYVTSLQNTNRTGIFAHIPVQRQKRKHWQRQRK